MNPHPQTQRTAWKSCIGCSIYTEFVEKYNHWERMRRWEEWKQDLIQKDNNDVSHLKPFPNCSFSPSNNWWAMRLCLFAVKAIAMLTIKWAREQNNGAVPFLSPELAIFSTGHKEYVRELCTRHGLHVKFVIFAGLEVPWWGQKFVLGHSGSADHCRVTVGCSDLGSIPPSSFFWFTEEIADPQESFMAAISLRLRVFSTLRFLHPWPWDCSLHTGG